MKTTVVPNPRCTGRDVRGDLMVDRAGIISRLRAFFDSRGFLEVETPALIPVPDPSPHVESFHTALCREGHGQLRLALRTSPELCMKRLLACGYPRIYQICKFFRNGEVSGLHNPEFTGLEWYEANAGYEEVMELTEELVVELAGGEVLEYQGRRVELRRPWERLTVHEAFERYAGIGLPTPITTESLRAACRASGVGSAPDDGFDDLFFRLFITRVEPHIGVGAPTFLKDYPIEMAALARAKPGLPSLAERVELYIAGLELANGYGELTDPAEQRRRFEEEAGQRRGRGEDWPWGADPGLVVALESGLPPSGGIAVGLDRLMMLLLDAPDLASVLPFPFKSEECALYSRPDAIATPGIGAPDDGSERC